jgi:hypothetical protein
MKKLNYINSIFARPYIGLYISQVYVKAAVALTSKFELSKLASQTRFVVNNPIAKWCKLLILA